MSSVGIKPKNVGVELIVFQDPRVEELFVDCIYQYPQILVCVSDHLSTIARNNKIVVSSALLPSVSTSDHGKQV